MKATILLSKIDRIEIYQNTKKYYKEKIKSLTGCDYIMNGAFFSSSYKPLQTLKVDGKLVVKDPIYNNEVEQGYLGYGWNTAGDIQLTRYYNSFKNFICCMNGLQDGKSLTMYYNDDVKGSRPRTAMGLTKDSLVLYCDKAGKTPEQVRDILKNMGCLSMICLDGGGSTQGNFNGTKVNSSENSGNGRICYSYVLVYLKKDTVSTTTSSTNTSTTTTTSSSTSKTGTYKVTASVLNIRSGAGTKYIKVGTYKKDTKVSVTSISNGWGKTDKGYVSMAYLSFVSASSTSVTTYLTGKYKVNASSLNIRSGAGTGYSKVGGYIKDTIVEVISISNGWGKTDKGWVSMSYLTKVEDSTSTVTSATTSSSSVNNLREQFVKFALSQVGKNEANADDDVYIKWYNSVMGTNFAMNVSWCSIWVSYNARHVNIPTDQILTTASCTSAMTWFKKKGTWKEAQGSYLPKRADLIYFNTDGNGSNVEHVGIVTKRDSTRVYTVEGNSSDSVKENSYLLTNVKVYGYVDWDNSGSGK